MADEKTKQAAEGATPRKRGRPKKVETGQAARAAPKPEDNPMPQQSGAAEGHAATESSLAVAEQVVLIPLDKLRPFKDHPFKVRDDDDLMQDTIDSIMAGGVINPILVRPVEDGFEVVSGHRRFRASELAGKDTIKAIVREMDDDTAVITMVDSNLQRENILPSERAFSYRMKMDAMRRQAGRPSKDNSRQVGANLPTAELVGQPAGDSARQVQRFIRLTELIPQLLDMVDNKGLAFNPAVELSYLKRNEQEDFIQAMDYGQATPSLSQAQRIKRLSQNGQCTLEAMCQIMNEEKKGELDRVTIRGDVLRKYFPKSYTPLQMQETIIKLLEAWQKKRTRQNER